MDALTTSMAYGSPWEIPPEVIFLITVAFLIGGVFKGFIGLGLPAISLGIMALGIQLLDAMAILLLPLFATNFWQGITGGYFIKILFRLWPLFLTGAVGTWFAVGFMVHLNPSVLAIILGLVLSSYAAQGLAKPQISFKRRCEPVLSAATGAITGVIGGLTGSMAVPAAPYIQALGMPSTALIQSLGIWFCIGSLSLGAALESNGISSSTLTIISTAAIVPAFLGMVVGQRLRLRLSEDLFRKVFFIGLTFLGLYIAGRGFYRL